MTDVGKTVVNALCTPKALTVFQKHDANRLEPGQSAATDFKLFQTFAWIFYAKSFIS